MDKEVTKQQVLDFMQRQRLAVVSTVNAESEPEAALVGFGQTDDFGIIFGTNTSTRKYKNIQQNPNVAFVIGWDSDRTVQLEGIATELANTPEDRELVEKNYWAKTPSAKRFDGEVGQVYFLVRALWVRYVALSQYEYEFRL